MALAQAARQSEHAYRHFADRLAAADVVMTGYSAFGLVGGVDLDAVAKSGFVERSAKAWVGLPFSGRTDDGKVLDATTVFPVAAVDQRLGTDVERWKMLSGRPARLNTEYEATASFVLAERLGLHVGSTLDIRFYRASNFVPTAAKFLQGLPPVVANRERRDPPEYADGPSIHLTVVGIEASPAEFPPLLTELAPVLHLTPAFAHRFEHQIVGSPISYVKLRAGRDVKSFQLAIERLAAGKPVSFVSTRSNQGPKVQRSVHAEAVALGIVAALVGLAGVVGVGQAMTRQVLAESEQLATLRFLGMRHAQIRTLVAARLVGIALFGIALASVFAIFGSDYALLPLARKAELDPGAQIDTGILFAGAVAVLLLALVIALWSTRIALRSAVPSTRGPADADAPARAGPALSGVLGRFPLPIALGVQFALQRARRAVPAWATMLALGLSASVLAGALTFTANLHHLLAEPHRYGWNWDVKVGSPGLPDIFRTSLQPVLARDPNVVALSAGTVTQISLNRVDRIDVLSMDRVEGDALPTMLSGRAPIKRDEIALGARTMRKVGARVGGRVEARIGIRSRTLRVVGQTVMPEVGDAGQLGTGALMTFAGIRELLPDAPDNTFLVRFRNDAATDGAHLANAVEPLPTRTQARPADLVDLARGGGLTFALVVLIAILAFVLLSHALITSVRSRRQEFAVLRAMGLRRGQVVNMVVWQSLTLATGALVIGLLVGSILGQVTWQVFAHDLGVASDSSAAPAALLAIIGGGLGLALLAAVAPGAIAARTRPTRELRSE
jgi:ABC-type lipoprotein release transport system permease subunit